MNCGITGEKLYKCNECDKAFIHKKLTYNTSHDTHQIETLAMQPV